MFKMQFYYENSKCVGLSIKSCAQESGLMFGAVVVNYGVDDENF